MFAYSCTVFLPHDDRETEVPATLLTGVDPDGDPAVRTMSADGLFDIRPLHERGIGDRVFICVPTPLGDSGWVAAVVRSEPFIRGSPGQKALLALSVLHQRGELVEGKDYVGAGEGRLRLAVASCGEKLAGVVDIIGAKALRSALEADASVRPFVLDGDVRFRADAGFVRGVEIDQLQLARHLYGFEVFRVTRPRTRGGARPGAGRPRKRPLDGAAAV